MNKAAWFELMAACGLASNEEELDKLETAYGESHRSYHTMTHVEACLASLGPIAHLAEHPREIELALWFHDAVYDPKSAENELQSAEWARRFLAGKLAPDVVQRVFDLIMVTVHSAPCQTIDQALLVDADLSILGAEVDAYATFEAGIREEYKWVPKAIYCNKRAEILAGFLARDEIYSAPIFREKLEAKARLNMAHAIEELEQGRGGWDR